MEAAQIGQFLTGARKPRATLDFLADEYIPAITSILNDPGTRRRMALYGGDRIPENERNLTDVRNRMSLLIEYKLGWIGNTVLEKHGISDIFWTNVVANRFPDLEVRDHHGNRGVRIEVKCLQAIAEEKSANFDTLKKDLNPRTDYIVVLIWEWVKDQAAIAWDRAPKIVRAFVFHASSLAELRDYNWLENPPGDLGSGFQGFDIRYAVNCRKGKYNEEEGNYGKLLRIWNEGVSYRPGLNRLLKATISTYLEFEDFTVWSGFQVLAKELLEQLGGSAPEPVTINGTTIGYRRGDLGIIFRRRVASAPEQRQLVEAHNFQQMIVMNDKYQWGGWRMRNGRLAKFVAELGQRKPKHLALYLLRNSVPSGTARTSLRQTSGRCSD
jgi:hypothetical protein